MIWLLWALGCGTPPPAEPAGCTAERALRESPRICMNLPEGFEARPGSGSTLTVAHPDEPRRAIVLKWMPDPGGDFFGQQRRATLEGSERDPSREYGETPDGSGVWVRYTLATRNVGPDGEHMSERRYGMAVARASGHVVWCRAELPPGTTASPGFLEACGSLQVP